MSFWRSVLHPTGPQFIPILRRQRDHAVEQDPASRLEGLIKDIDGAT